MAHFEYPYLIVLHPRVGCPNIILLVTNTQISDQMGLPKMIFGSIWLPGDEPFPALADDDMLKYIVSPTTLTFFLFW